MSYNFLKLISFIELDEIIDIIKNHIIDKSTENENSGYIKFIDFKYPMYFIGKFGVLTISQKIYNYFLMHTKRRCYDKDKNIDELLKDNFDDKLINNIIFYDHDNKSCDVDNKNIIGFIFPIMDRNYCRDTICEKDITDNDIKNHDKIKNINIKNHDKIKNIDINTQEITTCYNDGKIHQIYCLKNSLLHGEHLTYYNNGKIYIKKIYDNGNMISAKYFDP